MHNTVFATALIHIRERAQFGHMLTSRVGLELLDRIILLMHVPIVIR